MFLPSNIVFAEAEWRESGKMGEAKIKHFPLQKEPKPPKSLSFQYFPTQRLKKSKKKKAEGKKHSACKCADTPFSYFRVHQQLLALYYNSSNVCAFVCSHTPPRSFNGSSPNLVGVCRWTSELPLRGSFLKSSTGQRVKRHFFGADDTRLRPHRCKRRAQQKACPAKGTRRLRV